MAKQVAVQDSADALNDDLEYEVGSDAAGESVYDEGSDAASAIGEEESDVEVAGKRKDAADTGKQAKPGLTVEEKREKRKAKREVSKKRKRAELGLEDDHEDGVSTSDAAAAGSEDAVQATHKKTKRALTSKIPLAPEQQSDLLAKLFLDHHPGLTSIELLDKTPPLKAICDTADTASEARGDDEALCAFLAKYTRRKELNSANKEPGTPHTLILCASAMRVADVVRPLKAAYKPALVQKRGGKQQQQQQQSQKKGKGLIEIVKLFGKEKLKDQVAMLAETRVSIAVGVPGRVAALLAAPTTQEDEGGEGALKVRQLEQIILDCSHLDSKQRGLLSIKEVCKDLATCLGGGDAAGAQRIRERLRDGTTQILFF